MNKKISDKDKKDWQRFIDSKEKVLNKDINSNSFKENTIEKTVDLHGYSLQEANIKIESVVNECFEKNIKKLLVITGKGSRSKTKYDPYKSKKLGILKYSVPEFIKSNSDLMKKIKNISIEDIENSASGSFKILLKNKFR